MANLFPKTTEWIMANKDEGWQKTFFEYFYNVEYHFDHAQSIGSRVLSGITNVKGIKINDTSARLDNFSPGSVILSGDVAIREASSAIETAWVLVNHALGLNVQQDGLRWKPHADDDIKSLRLAMIKNSKYSDLVYFIDAIFDSTEYIYLSGYRNWVTHRGAPSLIMPFDPTKPFLIPPDILSQSGNDDINARITKYLGFNIPQQIDVCCFPFVHKVNEHIGTPPESDPNLNVREFAVTKGSLFDKKKDFDKNNREHLEKKRITVAGENLAVYSAFSYFAGIFEVRRYIEKMLSCDLDEALFKAISR